jgi:hypothetical protein
LRTTRQSSCDRAGTDLACSKAAQHSVALRSKLGTVVCRHTWSGRPPRECRA